MTFEPKCKGTSCGGCRYSVNDKIDYNNPKCNGTEDIHDSCALDTCPLIHLASSDEEKEKVCARCNWTPKEVKKEETIHKKFTKEKLRNGMVVDTRGSGKFLYVKSDIFEYLISLEDHSITELNCYEEDLRFKRHLINEIAPYMDITSVYMVHNLAFFSAPLKTESERFLSKIWERYDDFDEALEMIAKYFEVEKESIDLYVDGCDL